MFFVYNILRKKNVLRTLQLYAKLNKNVGFQSFSIKIKRKQPRTIGVNKITTRFSACNFET
jgi:hypothetical protein